MHIVIQQKPGMFLASLPHKLEQLLDALRQRAAHISRKQLIVSLAVLGMAVTGVYGAFFFWPKQISFSVAGQTCFTQPLLLPGLITQNSSDSYKAVPQSTIKFGKTVLYSRQTCITPTQAPKAHTAQTITFGNKFLRSHITVTTQALPQLASTTAFKKPLATTQPLKVSLDTADAIFEYKLAANNAVAPCAKKQQTVTCNVAQLNLAQSATYTMQLQRFYKNKPADVVLARSVATVQAVEVAGTSIAAQQVVLDKPNSLIVTLNRPVETIDGVRLELLANNTRQKLPITTTLDGTTFTVTFAEPLPRSTAFELTVESATAADGGFLPTAFVLPFQTSGGPRVTGINIGSSQVATSPTIVLTFDTKIGGLAASAVRLEINGNLVESTVSAKGKQVTIKPTSSFPLCTTFTVRVTDELQNEFGIAGGSAWQRNSRAICHTSFSIGQSVKGRSITAYRFGNGSSKIVFVGGTHGNEKSSVYSLNSLIDYLETHPDKIPTHRTVTIIPNLNPDGFAAGTRTNANNVDLNRNFPANNWKQGVTMPDGTYNANGGGSAPLSEPESSALAAYVVAQDPRLVLTYHAAAGVVIPNDSGDSDSLAHTYDQKSNVGYAANSQTSSLFDYDTTGAFEDWLHDKHDIPALLIELWTMSGNEFSKNQTAMLYMIGL